MKIASFIYKMLSFVRVLMLSWCWVDARKDVPLDPDAASKSGHRTSLQIQGIQQILRKW